MRYLARLILIACVALLSARAMAIEPPRIAHYVSEFARISFVLDLTGELAKIRFDGNEEIFVLQMRLAGGGDRALVRDDNETILRISGLGGVTLYTPDNRRGIPMAPARGAQPLVASTPPIGLVRDTAGRIMMRLRAETGKEIVFEANWNAVAGDRIATSILYDAIRNAGTALFEIVRTGPGRAAVIARLNRVRFVQAGASGVSMQGDMLIVYFSASQGLAGRPSSALIARQLRQILR